MSFKEEEVLDDVRVQEAEGEALGQEAGDDAAVEGGLGGVFRVKEQGIPYADVLDEAVNLFGADSAFLCLEGLSDPVILVEAHVSA